MCLLHFVGKTIIIIVVIVVIIVVVIIIVIIIIVVIIIVIVIITIVDAVVWRHQQIYIYYTRQDRVCGRSLDSK